MRTVAVEAALAGAELVRRKAGDVGAIRSKSSQTDLVTETDVASGVAIVRALLSALPGARVLVEEPEVHQILGIEPASLDEPELWVVDPVDGTTSFVHGYPCFSVAVALLREGRPVAGSIHHVALDETFSAAKGQGAEKNGVSIRCSDAARLEESLLVTGFPYDRGAPLDTQLSVLAAFLRAPVHGIRRDGSAAVDCCHVASGRCDGFWEYALKPWDTAAGVCICTEAGARATDIDGAEWTSRASGILVANPSLHERMLAVIERAAAV